MSYIDLHCDTASRLLYENQSLKKNDFSIDIEKLKRGGCLAQVFAFFIDAGIVSDISLEFEVMYRNFLKEIEKNRDNITIVKNLDELKVITDQGKIGAFLSIEEGDVLNGKVENLKKVYDKGIRIITLTWNYKNKIAHPNYNLLYKDEGLTDVGIEIVKEMEHLGIIPDVSHISDRSFYDLLEICKKPIIASHSNSRAITNHPRNLTDDMIKLLADKGGVMGINFCSDFLGINKISSINDMITHIKHIRNIGGIDVISLGSDFDGIENKVQIEDASKMNKLREALDVNGFSEEEIDKIFYNNALRVFRETLK